MEGQTEEQNRHIQHKCKYIRHAELCRMQVLMQQPRICEDLSVLKSVARTVGAGSRRRRMRKRRRKRRRISHRMCSNLIKLSAPSAVFLNIL